jgi:ribosomal protein S18 acetylase RimI-like enzyme
MRPAVISASRFLLGLRGPSGAANARLLRRRGESLESLAIREATVADIPALAELHVTTWNATYAGLFMKGPPVAVRAHQWRDAFAAAERRWFCVVIETRAGDLVGFAKGRWEVDSPASGELNKIYLLRHYQRLGLGRRLVGHVTRRFLAQGRSSMSLFADPRNPSCRFYEALGGEPLREADGTINYNWYVWRDLRRLAEICPVD